MSPLKGCSMLAEQVAGKRPAPPVAASARLCRGPVAKARASMIHAIAQNLLQDPEFWSLWKTELHQTRAADWLREDLFHSLPAHPNEWIQAAERARGSACPARWLIIPPETHNFAWLYPILLGSVLGLELHLRARVDEPLVLELQKRLAPLGGFTSWAAPQRIGVDPMPDVDAVMLYGSDETIAAVQAACPVPVKGFGSSLAVSIIHGKGELEPLLKDAFSLLQKGCMASRVLFLLQDPAVEVFQEGFLRCLQTATHVVGPLPLGMELALEHAAFGLRCQSRMIAARPGEGAPLLLMQTFDPQKNLDSVLLDRAMSLSLVVVPKNLWPDFAEWLPAQKNLHKIAVHDQGSLPLTLDTRLFECVEAGQANAPKWDGRHQGRPLFTLG
jgi:hypothetical protein